MTPDVAQDTAEFFGGPLDGESVPPLVRIPVMWAPALYSDTLPGVYALEHVDGRARYRWVPAPRPR